MEINSWIQKLIWYTYFTKSIPKKRKRGIFECLKNCRNLFMLQFCFLCCIDYYSLLQQEVFLEFAANARAQEPPKTTRRSINNILWNYRCLMRVSVINEHIMILKVLTALQVGRLQNQNQLFYQNWGDNIETADVEHIDVEDTHFTDGRFLIWDARPGYSIVICLLRIHYFEWASIKTDFGKKLIYFSLQQRI